MLSNLVYACNDSVLVQEVLDLPGPHDVIAPVQVLLIRHLLLFKQTLCSLALANIQLSPVLWALFSLIKD